MSGYRVGMIGRCNKVAGTMEDLLGGEVYHYHTKLMMKEAHTGGSFVWHQDYGYITVCRVFLAGFRVHYTCTPLLLVHVCSFGLVCRTVW